MSRGQLSTVEVDRVQVAVGAGLGQHATNGEVGGVGLDGDWQVRLEMAKDRSRCEGVLQLPKSLACFLCPGKLAGSLAGQVS